MQFEAHVERVLERLHEWFIFLSRTAVRIAISDIIRCASIDEFLLRCVRIEVFLMLKVSNSYEQHSVLMQELEDG